MNITHVVLWVQDATLSAKFYKKLGFEIVHVTDRDARVQSGSFGIQLVTMRDEEEFGDDALANNKGRGMYIYVHVDDVDATYQFFLSKAIEVRSEPRDWPWGNREFVIKDPDGYKLCFWQKK